MRTYDLRSLALVLLIVPGCVYVLGHPSAGTTATLGWLLGPTSQQAWGVCLSASGLTALAVSAVTIRAGFIIIMLATGFWVVALVLGLLFLDFTWSGLASAVIYTYLFDRARTGLARP